MTEHPNPLTNFIIFAMIFTSSSSFFLQKCGTQSPPASCQLFKTLPNNRNGHFLYVEKRVTKKRS